MFEDLLLKLIIFVKRINFDKYAHYFETKKQIKKGLEDWYFNKTHKVLDLKNPQSYNEKIQWLKLYDSTPLKTKLADKYLVREWIKDKIGEQYLIPLLGVYKKFSDINFDDLPNQFVIKCNHGCGYNIIVRNKADFDKEKAEIKINNWLKENYAYKAGYELHYKKIKPLIIIEQYLNDGSEDIDDYKFWCFDGKVEYIQYLTERSNGLKMAFFDREWQKQDFTYNYPLNTNEIKKPDVLDEMIRLSEVLSKGFPHVRVDFYIINNEIKFGEMTFTSYSGICGWNDESANMKLGKLIKLPK